jgi:hypothetical protein
VTTLDVKGRVLGFRTRKQDVGIIKILQTERSFVILVRADVGLMSVQWQLLMSVQRLLRTTAESYAASFLRTGVGSQLVSLGARFLRRQRLVMSDGDAAIALAERALWNSPSFSSWNLLHLTCAVHRAAAARSSVMAQLGRHSQALTHLALSLRAPAAMRTFRSHLRAVLCERLEFRRCSASRVDLIRNEELLNLVMPPAVRRYRFARVTVLGLANGDWASERVVHNCSGCCADEWHCKSRFCDELTRCLVTEDLLSYPSRNWQKCEGGPGIVALFTLLHGLLPVVYQRWASTHIYSDSAVDGPDYEHGVRVAAADAGEAAPAAAVEVRAEEIEAAPAVPEADGPAVAAVPLPENIGPAVVDSYAAQRLEQSQHCKSAQHWLNREDPLGALLVARAVLEPHREYMEELIEAAGDDWQMKSNFSGVFSGLDAPVADPRTVIAFRCVFESKPIASLIELMNASAWISIPARCKKQSLRTRLFCMLSCSLAALEEECDRNRRFPMRMFSILHDRANLDEIARMPVCCLDQWSQKLLVSWQGWSVDDIAADLETLSRVVKLDTVQIEALHASLRRVLVALSVQTHTRSVECMAEHIVNQRARNLRTTLRPSAENPAIPSVFDAKTKQIGKRARLQDGLVQPSKRSRGQGGRWHAFISKHTRGVAGRIDFAALARQFNRADETELRECEIDGVLATLSSRQGCLHWGPRCRDVKARQAKALCIARAELAMVDVSGGNDLQLTSSRTNEACKETSAKVSATSSSAIACFNQDRRQELSRLLRVESMLRNALRARRDEAVQSWFRRQTSVDAFLKVGGAFVQSRYDLVPLPTCKESILRCLWSPVSMLPQCAQLAAVSCTQSKLGQAMGAQLDHAWKQLHEPIPVRKWKTAPPRPPPPRACQRVGFCVCGENSQIAEMSKRLSQSLRQACPPRSQMRTKLSRGEVVVALVGREVDVAWAPGDDPDALLWLHVSKIDLVSFEAQVMCLNGDRCLQWPPRGKHVLHTSLPPRVMSQTSCIKSLCDPLRKWAALLYTVHFEERIVLDFAPITVEVVWPPGVQHEWSWFYEAAAPCPAEPGDEGWEALDRDDCESEQAEPDIDEGGREDGADSECVDIASVVGGSDHSSLHDGEDLLEIPDIVAVAERAEVALCPLDLVVPCAAAAVFAVPIAADGDAIAPAGAEAEAANDVTIALGAYGHITFYKSKGEFYAYCAFDEHHEQSCRKVRVGMKAKAKNNPATGRPLGFLVSWLMEAHLFPTSADHRKHEVWCPSQEMRSAARDFLVALPGSAALFAFERLRRPGEGDEPERCP